MDHMIVILDWSWRKSKSNFVWTSYVSVSLTEPGSNVVGGGEGCESSPISSSSNAAPFSFGALPLRSFDRRFWNQTYKIFDVCSVKSRRLRIKYQPGSLVDSDQFQPPIVHVEIYSASNKIRTLYIRSKPTGKSEIEIERKKEYLWRKTYI